MQEYAAIHDLQPLKDLGGGVTRRVLAHNPEMLAAEVAFETGAAGSVHTHPHTQISYVLSGRFRYTIDGRDVDLGPGDSVVVPSGLPHGTVCLAQGALLDVFTPERTDFLG